VEFGLGAEAKGKTMTKTMMIPLTGEQTELLHEMLSSMEEGGACFAQVYGDGMRVRTFDQATATRVRNAIGQYLGNEGLHNSAEEAHEAAKAALN
jgi:hypothetical protein